jgi:glutathione S-transferase
MSDYPILYSFRRCPYAIRARLALAVAGIGVQLREVLLRAKPAAMLQIAPQGTVPVLQLANQQVLAESLDIMAWALACGDPAGWLNFPAAQLAPMRELVAENDGSFKAQLDRYKYADRYVTPGEDGAALQESLARTQCEVFLCKLESRLQQHAQLFADQVSYADMAILPFIRQFAAVDPAWFAVSPYPALRRWLQGHLQGELFQAVMFKQKPWQPGDSEILWRHG